MITQLTKEKILTRKTNPLRSTTLGNLIDEVKKIIKKENREFEEKDVIIASKRLIKECQSTIDIISKSENSAYSREILDNREKIKIYEEFIPPMIPLAALELFINGKISEIPPAELNMKSMGKLTGIVKKEFGELVDMAMASKIIKEKING